MKNSLSAIVPVLNCQSTAQALVGQLLEVLEELTPRFELLVIDNGSTDATLEALAELALCYPQLKLVTHATRRGAADVMRTGLRTTSGEIVLYRLESRDLGAGCLPEMWQAARSSDVVIAGREGAVRPTVPASPGSSPGDVPSWQMIRRRLLEAWARQRAEGDWLHYLHVRGHRTHEVVAGTSRLHRTANRTDRVVLRLPNAPREASLAAEPNARPAARRPNYLDRIKAFAWGE